MIDIHSHTPGKDSVYNLTLEELRNEGYEDQFQLISVGIHPWWITPEWEKDFEHVKHWSSLPQVKWIGETGLDKTKGPSLALQKKVFIEHALLSEKVNKPLLIHCVKAIDELLVIKKALKPQQIWIFHGFRGKPQQMQQLLHAGFHLSFGYLFNKDAFEACPIEFRHSETDDTGLSIKDVLNKQGILPENLG